ncbi:signal transduction histidine kinase [Microterricola gilva]|uniref:Signal transduction histidine kinase n=2 Tax=Microterricola gilva TaxID=393267 RepID=A0A4Q8APJ4_9MICO|nr:signal transduction histidine kinase [Microterricola gilva]
MLAVSVLLAAIMTLLDPPVSGEEWGVVGVIAVVLAAYFAWGRRTLDGTGSPAGLLYAGVLLVSLAVGIGLDPTYSFMQVIVFPTLWVISCNTRQAVLLNLLAIVPVAIGYTLFFGVEGLPSGIAVGVLSVAFSLAFGSWIASIEKAGAERARLLAELMAVQDELAAANREAGVDSERARLAREIHDTIAQSLTGLVMVAQRAHGDLERAADAAGDASEHLVQATADVELIESMARDALTEARGLVAAIAPVRVESTLAEALGRLAERFQRETGVVVLSDLAALAAPAPPLRAELEVVLLRCAQEGLANVRKHARATAASVQINRGENAVILVISDDGVGPGRAASAQSGTAAASAGFGLAGMADRLALVGGSARLEAALPRGSRLTVTVPLASEPAAPEPSIDAANGVQA